MAYRGSPNSTSSSNSRSRSAYDDWARQRLAPTSAPAYPSSRNDPAARGATVYADMQRRAEQQQAQHQLREVQQQAYQQDQFREMEITSLYQALQQSEARSESEVAQLETLAQVEANEALKPSPTRSSRRGFSSTYLGP